LTPQGFSDQLYCYNEEIELQTAEEVVDDGCSFSSDYGEHIPGIPDAADLGLESFSSEYVASSRRRKGKGKKSPKNLRQFGDTRQLGEGLTLQGLDPSSSRRWERKQVQIRTSDGEFSVTMWASGTISFYYYSIGIELCGESSKIHTYFITRLLNGAELPRTTQPIGTVEAVRPVPYRHRTY